MRENYQQYWINFLPDLTLSRLHMKDFQNRCRLKIDKVEFVPVGTIPDDAKKVVDLRKEVIL